MSEDFGWAGDERMIGDCMDDWAMDRLDMLADQAEEREQVREELADKEYPEPVGQDLSEYDEGGEYGECEWED